MKAGLNKLLVEVDKVHEDTITYGTLELYKDPMFNPTQNIRIYGIVKAVPMNEDITDNHGTRFKMNIEVGDKVYFRYVGQENTTMRIAEYGKKDLISIPFSDAFCVVRDGKIIPCAGWCFGEPLVEESGLKLFMENKASIISSINPKRIAEKTKVLIVGTDTIVGEESNLEPGDMVYGFLIAFENTIEGKSYYCFKEEDIDGKIKH